MHVSYLNGCFHCKFPLIPAGQGWAGMSMCRSFLALNISACTRVVVRGCVGYAVMLRVWKSGNG